MYAERRALYNSLRQNWQSEPNLAVEPWQVEDYRNMPLNALFERLKLQDIHLDKSSYLKAAEELDSPEQLTDLLLEGNDADGMTHDQVYLLIFELWRRLVPEKPSLTIFCDELDHQISLYDSGRIDNAEALQDVIANLQVVIDENTDEGADPAEVFDMISHNCANDLESFLYDYIAEQMDAGDDAYATELLDDFAPYVKDTRWFDFLRARLLAPSDPQALARLLRKICAAPREKGDLEFNLEVLSFLVTAGEKEDFTKVVRKTVQLLSTEEDFQDLLTICADFYHRLDHDEIEKGIFDLIKKRTDRPLEASFLPTDPDIAVLYKILA